MTIEPRCQCQHGHDCGPCSCRCDPFGGGMCDGCLDASRDCEECHPYEESDGFVAVGFVVAFVMVCLLATLSLMIFYMASVLAS